jgi:formylglycine-generating enzyme required for sulfatase activity
MEASYALLYGYSLLSTRAPRVVYARSFEASSKLMAQACDKLRPMLRIALFVLLLVQTLTSSDALAQQTSDARRVALVIGNDRYKNIPSLRNARADAMAVADALRESGFDVIARYDLDERSLRASVREFTAGLSGGDEAVFYYAGHGVQLGAGNFLLPTDIAADDEARVRDESLALQRVLDDLTERRVRFSLAIIDACRNNPFPADRERSIRTGRGLAPTTPATGQMVMFSAGVGQTALDLLDDRDRSRNGVFTRVLLRELRKEGVPADQILRNVRDEVVRLARSVGHEQVPALYDQSIGRFYLKRSAATAGDAPGPAPMAAAAPAPVESASQSNERLFWESVKDSRSPEELRTYLQRFPDGVFAELARVRIDALTRAQGGGASAPVATAAAATPKPAAPVPAPPPAAVAVSQAAPNDADTDWVPVPAGEFRSGEAGLAVTLPAFRIQRTEVTNRQYASFVAQCPMGDQCGPRSLPSYWDDAAYLAGAQEQPVVFVSWVDAAAFCAWAGGELPTAQEWEKAARGTDGRTYPTGEAIPPGAVNILGPEGRAARRSAAARQIPTWAVNDPRYARDRSAFGVLGMTGNVSEWTATPGGSRGELRLVAGASWDSWESADAIVHQTLPKRTSDASSSLGFRCVKR